MKKKISLAFAHNSEEMRYIIEKSNKKLTWVPLNLENLLYLKNNKLEYINPIKILKNEFHKECIIELEKLRKKIHKSFHHDQFIQSRYLSIMIKYFVSIFFILKLTEKINQKNKIENIYLSGWNDYNFKSINGNFFISQIIYNLFKKNYNIILIDGLKNQKIYKVDLKLFFPKIKNKKYLFLSNLHYNFFRIIKLCFKNNLKILTVHDNNITFFKKIIFKILGVNFIFIKEKKIFNQSNAAIKIKKIFPKINYRYNKYDFSKLLSLRSNQFFTEFEQLLILKKNFKDFFDKSKPSKVILNTTRGINNYIISYTKKKKIPCYIIPHGTISSQKNKYSKIYNKIISEELVSSSGFNCAQSKIALKFYKKNKIKKVLKTGNLIFSESIPKEKKYILYAVTNRDFNNYYPWGIETFYEYYDNIKILDKLAKDQKLEIIVQLHPNIRYLKQKLENEFYFLKFSNEKIEKVLQKSFVTLSFSSTSIEESLYSKVPVILFDRWKRYKHCESNNNINKKNTSIYYLNDDKKLIKVINTIKQSKQIDFNKYLFPGMSSKNFENNLIN